MFQSPDTQSKWREKKKTNKPSCHSEKNSLYGKKRRAEPLKGAELLELVEVNRKSKKMKKKT